MADAGQRFGSERTVAGGPAAAGGSGGRGQSGVGRGQPAALGLGHRAGHLLAASAAPAVPAAAGLAAACSRAQALSLARSK